MAELDDTFAALADPVRRAILTRLRRGEATVGELAASFPITQQAVSKHVRVLERAGLVTRGRDAQRRPCRLRTEPLDRTAAWLDAHRRATDARLDRLEQLLRDPEETP
jgi:DNA-binding transcriptional ArsR family regulator